jgi:hypothetical protein
MWADPRLMEYQSSDVLFDAWYAIGKRFLNDLKGFISPCMLQMQLLQSLLAS